MRVGGGMGRGSVPPWVIPRYESLMRNPGLLLLGNLRGNCSEHPRGGADAPDLGNQILAPGPTRTLNAHEEVTTVAR